MVLHAFSRELCCSSYDETLKYYLPSDVSGWSRLLQATPRLDWIWIGGGALMSAAHAPFSDPNPAWQYQLIQRSEATGTRIAFMSVGATQMELVNLTHALLSSATYVSVRDEVSVQVVRHSKANRSQVALTHDPVLMMNLPDLNPLPSSSNRKVHTCWILQGPWRQNPTISLLVDSYYLPGEDLVLTLEQKDGNFYGHFNPDFIRLYDRDLKGLYQTLVHCQFVVSMRYHGNILASVAGIPSLGLDMSVNITTPGKVGHLFTARELDRPDCILYPARTAGEGMTLAEVKEAYETCRGREGAIEHLHKRMEAMRKEFRAQMDALLAS